MTTNLQMFYIYDLPKTVTSMNLAEAIKKETKILIESAYKPQIQRDHEKPFYSAIIKFQLDSKEKIEEVTKNLKYFNIDGK